jgi:hypothetical protein
MTVANPSGAAFFIGPQNTAAVSVSGYSALVYTQVKQVETIPQFGPTGNVIKFTPLETGTVNKRVGSVDNGEPQLVCFMDNADTGQLAMLTAFAAKNTQFAFKITLSDVSNTVYYFHGYVASMSTEPGASDNIPRRRFTIAITGDIVETP